MVLVFSDDGCVRIAESEAKVIRDCEGVDVQSGVWWFFDETGRPLVPVFDVPVQETRVLGVFRMVDSGQYHLEPGDSSHPLYVDPLWLSLQEAVMLEPNPHFASLAHLKAALRARGVQVDPPA